MIKSSSIPGTAAYYDKHIYTSLSETIGLGLNDTPSTVILWVAELGFIPTDCQQTILEIGCGAGRNLNALVKSFPKAHLYGFDGSPLALSIAKQGLPDVELEAGNIFDVWPFHKKFDIVFDITAGIPESPTEQDLNQYILSLHQSVKTGGYAVIEAISSNDKSSRRFGDGNLVHWVSGRDKKTERLVSLQEASELYEKQGFEVISSRKERFKDKAFGVMIDREFIQLVLRKKFRQ